jgi:hypothetical protein
MVDLGKWEKSQIYYNVGTCFGAKKKKRKSLNC